MTLHADDRDILDRISADLADEEPHLTGMYRVFSRLTIRDLIPDEDAVRRLPRRPQMTRGYGRGRSSGPAAGGFGAFGPLRRARPILTGRQARILAIPALLLAVLITIIAFTAGGSPRCTRAASLHGGLGMAGASCPAGAAPPANP